MKLLVFFSLLAVTYPALSACEGLYESMGYKEQLAWLVEPIFTGTAPKIQTFTLSELPRRLSKNKKFKPGHFRRMQMTTVKIAVAARFRPKEMMLINDSLRALGSLDHPAKDFEAVLIGLFSSNTHKVHFPDLASYTLNSTTLNVSPKNEQLNPVVSHYLQWRRKSRGTLNNEWVNLVLIDISQFDRPTELLMEILSRANVVSLFSILELWAYFNLFNHENRRPPDDLFKEYGKFKPELTLDEGFVRFMTETAASQTLAEMAYISGGPSALRMAHYISGLSSVRKYPSSNDFLEKNEITVDNAPTNFFFLYSGIKNAVYNGIARYPEFLTWLAQRRR